ncbi:MAG: Gfo/Idh/MocA family oxidoreductase [Sedimentisphaerales bacterium]|nr:Gfo/Idh/MocA family oxidoreductase [Sedimentisphaerales bacterium]
MKISNTFNRRKFLAHSAAVAAFTIVEPSLVRGSQANSRIKVGLVGLGGRGSLIARIVTENHKGLHLTALADYFEQVVRAAGERFDVPKECCYSGLSGYKGVLAGKVDAILLETPPCFFPEHAATAVNAGVHVYMAKPVAVDVPGTLVISECGKRATIRRQVFFVDFQVPTDPFNIETVKRYQEGLIGETGLLSSFYTDEAFPDPSKTQTIESRLQNLVWVNDIDLGGGFLVNAGIHAIDAALWMAGGPPAHAMGLSRIVRDNPHGDTADVYSVTYGFDNDLILNHRGEHLKNTHGFTCNCIAYGRHGFAEIAYQGNAWIRGNKGGYRGGEVKDLYVQGIERNLDRFEQDVRQERYDNPTVERSVNSTLATILGREAGRRNARLTWDELIAEKRRIEPDLTGLKA